MLLTCLQHLLAVSDSGGQRLFAKHVLAGLRGCNNYVVMQKIGHAYRDKVDVVTFEHLVVILVSIRYVPFGRDFLEVVDCRYSRDLGPRVSAVRVAVKISGEFRTYDTNSDFIHRLPFLILSKAVNAEGLL